MVKDDDRDREDDFFNELFDSINKIFSAIFGIPMKTGKTKIQRSIPKTRILKHVLEKEKEYWIYLDIPGIDLRDVILQIKDNRLDIYVKTRDLRDVIEFKKPVKKKIKSVNYRNGILEIVVEKKK